MAQPSSTVGRLYFTERNFARLDRARELATRHGCTANQINLAYLMAQPFAVYPIAGCRTVEQVTDSCAAAHITLSAEELSYLVSNSAS
jgi:aryl-alcohol dehydrogenase-like predicted oxidoreductase